MDLNGKAKLAAALVKAQAAMGPALKSRMGQVPGNKEYKYADLPAVMEAISGPLHANGLAVLQSLEGNIDGIGARTTLFHESGESVTSDFCFMPVTVKSPQAFGSAATYARRYSLSAMLGVVTDADDDGAHANPRLPIERSTPTTAAQMVPALQASIDAIRNRPPDGPGMCFPGYGRAKGMPIKGASHEDLQWYRGGCEKTLGDPAKERYWPKERLLLAAIDAELAGQQ